MSRVIINIKIEEELRERLKKAAEEQNRTVSNLIETELLRVYGPKKDG